MKNYQMILASLLLGSFATPVEAAKNDNCHEVTFVNSGHYTARASFSPCTIGQPNSASIAWGGSPQSFSVKDKDNIVVEAEGGTQAPFVFKITADSDVICTGLTAFGYNCTMQKEVGNKKAKAK